MNDGIQKPRHRLRKRSKAPLARSMDSSGQIRREDPSTPQKGVQRFRIDNAIDNSINDYEVVIQLWPQNTRLWRTVYSEND